MPRPGVPPLVVSLVSAGAAAFLWLSLAAGGPANPPSRNRIPSERTASAAAANVTGPVQVATDLYAVEANGATFTSRAHPGSEVELWVLWDHPDPGRPGLEKLLPRATLDEMIPAFTPGGPDAAVLRVEVAEIPKLSRAEHRGVLEVRIPESPKGVNRLGRIGPGSRPG